VYARVLPPGFVPPCLSLSRPETRDFVAVGGLMSYSAQVAGLSRRAAEFADRILRGPMRRRCLLSIRPNSSLSSILKTAKALGLEVPSMLLALADEVIE